MSRDTSSWRKALSVYLLAGLPALSCAIPVLDMMVGDGGAAVEARHHPGTHGFPHNHLICIQQQANQWVMPSLDLLPMAVAAFTLPAFPERGGFFRPTQLSLPHPRAPPLV
ncbi:MAG: hypothetical protein PVJ76_09445 [Gemmatimonadota bacterium]|jgi:hypothetical protein